MSIVGEVIGAVKAAIFVGALIQEAFAFSTECRELQTRCRAVQTMLEQKESSLRDVSGITELAESLGKCGKYLASCKERRFIRNPVLEITFHRRIEKYRIRIDSWIITATLCLTVLHREGDSQM